METNVLVVGGSRMIDWTSIQSLEQLHSRFPSEESCFAVMYAYKWPQGFYCPYCYHNKAYLIRSRRAPLYECQRCGHQASLTAGTIMENTRTSFRKWFTALWLISCSEKGINAVQLSKRIDVTYKTSWHMLHKIRIAMHLWDVEKPLEGKVQGMGEFHARLDIRVQSEINPQVQPIIVAVSLDTQERVKMMKLKLIHHTYVTGRSLTQTACQHFIADHVASAPEDIRINYLYGRIMPFTRHLRQLFNAAHRWTVVTFNGLGTKYLQLYLDEYCYRINSRGEQYCALDQLFHLAMTRQVSSVRDYQTKRLIRSPRSTHSFAAWRLSA